MHGHTGHVAQIIGMNDYIISVGNEGDNSVRTWNKDRYEQGIKIKSYLECLNKSDYIRLTR